VKLTHLNLAGDCDEIAAIGDVEREFDISLDVSGAEGWFTVGDVFDALLLSLPDYLAKQPSSWHRFCYALCLVTGDDPLAIGRATKFIDPGLAWDDVVKGVTRLMKGKA
jgi:hypothetical protein